MQQKKFFVLLMLLQRKIFQSSDLVMQGDPKVTPFFKTLSIY